MNRTAGLVVALALLLAGLAAGVFFLGPPARTPPTNPAVRPGDAVPVPRVKFTDITAQAGIRFRHTNGTFGRKLLPETMGSGVAFLDFDNDGKQDLLFINSRPWPGDSGSPPSMALYRNNGDGTFEDVTEKMGLAVPLYGMGVTVGDYDNDGWVDIFVTALGGCKLFRNDGGKRFVDVTAEAGVGGPGAWPAGLSRDEFLKLDQPIAWPTSATFVDYDGDGRLDLFVCHYITWSPAADIAKGFALETGDRAYGRPVSFDGAQCVLYRNLDGRHFEDVSEKAGIRVTETTGSRVRPVGKALGVVACDPDGDGWPDLVVANDTVRNFFFHNVAGLDGTRRFEEIGLPTGIALVGGEPRGGMGVDVGEYLPDRVAVAVANFADEPISFLGRSPSRPLLFTDLAPAVGVAGPSQRALKFGITFLDFDLDGRLDLLTNDGHLEPAIAKVRPAQTYAQVPELYWNTGQARTFEPVTPADASDELFAPLVGRGSAYADIDGDGDLDIVLTANGGPARLLRNDCDLKNHWVRFTLEGDGKRSNRSAIGAVVTVEAGSRVIRRTVSAARGYLSQSELPVTIGLAKADRIDRVTVRWPGSAAGPDTVLTDVAIDRAHTIRQLP
ncbi:MAG: CRTAC1 family protein [Gemmataceae bacterium]